MIVRLAGRTPGVFAVKLAANGLVRRAARSRVARAAADAWRPLYFAPIDRSAGRRFLLIVCSDGPLTGLRYSCSRPETMVVRAPAP
jgi:hypothetical protein